MGGWLVDTSTKRAIFSDSAIKAVLGLISLKKKNTAQ
jgi:hypothetical protein